MTMWVYSTTVDPISENIITREYIYNVIQRTVPSFIDNEAIYYLRDLFRPFMNMINEYTMQELIAFHSKIPDAEGSVSYIDDNHCQYTFWETKGVSIRSLKLNLIKTRDTILKSMIQSLYENKLEDFIAPRITPNVLGNNITPWSIYECIKSSEILDKIFQPPPVVVNNTVTGENLSLSYQKLLGIMAIYRYLNKKSPFSMYGWNLQSSIDLVNDNGCFNRIIEHDGYFHIRIGSDIFNFTDSDFLEGVVAGCKLNQLDPHVIITNIPVGLIDKVNSMIQNYDITNSLPKNPEVISSEIKNPEVTNFLSKNHEVTNAEVINSSPQSLVVTNLPVKWTGMSNVASERKEYVDIIEYTKRGMSWRVKQLIEKKVDINERDASGDCAVIWAALRCDLETLKILVEAGADLNVMGGFSGMTPLDYAKFNKSNTMVRYIEQHLSNTI